MSERLKESVLKTEVLIGIPGVRIPLHPRGPNTSIHPFKSEKGLAESLPSSTRMLQPLSLWLLEGNYRVRLSTSCLTQLLQYLRGKRKSFSFESLLLKLPELTQQQAEQRQMPELFTMFLPSVNMDKNFLSKWRLKKSVLLAEPYLATSNPSF
uniref:Uncharacterized protein n=1 Tax=Ananas comosus var. bracteatus TaxID=296719 RepID=A0A6V7PYF8_ANACO|nr:unnamed protein product [Ananas comosus var. bracteatus]